MENTTSFSDNSLMYVLFKLNEFKQNVNLVNNAHSVSVYSKLRSFNLSPEVQIAGFFHDIFDNSNLTEIEFVSNLKNYLSDVSVIKIVFYIKELQNKYTLEKYSDVNAFQRKKLEFRRISRWKDDNLKIIKLVDILCHLPCLYKLDKTVSKVLLMDYFELINILSTEFNHEILDDVKQIYISTLSKFFK